MPSGGKVSDWVRVSVEADAKSYSKFYKGINKLGLQT